MREERAKIEQAEIENKGLDLSVMEEKLIAAAQKCRKSTIITLWHGGTTSLTQTNEPPDMDGTPGAKTYHLNIKEKKVDISLLKVPKQSVRAQSQV